MHNICYCIIIYYLILYYIILYCIKKFKFSFAMKNLSGGINHTTGGNTTWLNPRLELKDQASFVKS